jgi:putative hydrolase of the HAD superfamily
MMPKYLVWDFDGTLGYRVGGWSAVLQEVAQRDDPNYSTSAEELRAHLQDGFPWHTPHLPHPQCRSPEQWWTALDHIFERALTALGVEASQATRLARKVRHAYADPTCWRLFDDTIRVLDELQSQGWTHFILSNHVPELRSLTKHLELDSRISRIFNSAETDYEKPHPQAFQNVLDAVDDAATVWMIGDNMTADIMGATNLGIPAILVRKYHEKARYCCAELWQVAAIINQKLSDNATAS